MELYTLFISNDYDKLEKLKNVLTNCKVEMLDYKAAIYKLALYGRSRMVIILDRNFKDYELLAERIGSSFRFFNHFCIIFIDDIINVETSKIYKNIKYVPQNTYCEDIKKLVEEYSKEENRILMRSSYYREILISLGFNSKMQGFGYLLEISSLVEIGYKLDEKLIAPTLYEKIRRKENISVSNIERNLRTLISAAKKNGLANKLENLSKVSKITNYVVIKYIYDIFFSYVNLI